MTFREAEQIYTNNLSLVYDSREAASLAWLSISPVCKLERAEYLNLKDTEVPTDKKQSLLKILEELKTGKPLQYVIGETEFYGLTFKVNPSVLIPRPETEELIALAKTRIVNTNQTIADICTGSGCIAIAMRQWFPNNPILATDISESALATAKSSAALNFNQNTIQFHQHDLLTQTWPYEIPDIVICNPPYINQSEGNEMAPHVMLHEPHIALFVDHPDPLLFYKSLIQTFLPVAFPSIFFEMNPNYVEAIKHYCELHQLNCEIHLDMQGKERFAIISKRMN